MSEEIEYLHKYLEEDKLEEGLERLKNGEPVQYIVGDVNFYGNELMVNKNALIPRFETEELVSKTASYIRKYNFFHASVLDIGTGSGNIAITLKKMFPKFSITASDISIEALEVARKNAVLNETDIHFIQSDVFQNIEDRFSILISNPPYLSYDEDVMDIVYYNEPHLALYAEDDGLYFYKKIIKEASSYLKDKNMLAFEIGCTQGLKLSSFAKEYFPKAIISVEKDLSGRDRFLFILNL